MRDGVRKGGSGLKETPSSQEEREGEPSHGEALRWCSQPSAL